MQVQFTTIQEQVLNITFKLLGQNMHLLIQLVSVLSITLTNITMQELYAMLTYQWNTRTPATIQMLFLVVMVHHISTLLH